MKKRLGITLGWFGVGAVLYLIGVGIAYLAGPSWNGSDSPWVSGIPTAIILTLSVVVALVLSAVLYILVSSWWKWVKNG